MTTINPNITRRTGTEATVTWPRLTAGDAGAPIEPGRVPGAKPDAHRDAFSDLTVSFQGQGLPSDDICLLGSHDGHSWRPAVNTAGDIVSGKLDGAQHVKAAQYRFFAPGVSGIADPALCATVEIHLSNRG